MIPVVSEQTRIGFDETVLTLSPLAVFFDGTESRSSPPVVRLWLSSNSTRARPPILDVRTPEHPTLATPVLDHRPPTPTSHPPIFRTQPPTIDTLAPATAASTLDTHPLALTTQTPTISTQAPQTCHNFRRISSRMTDIYITCSQTRMLSLRWTLNDWQCFVLF